MAMNVNTTTNTATAQVNIISFKLWIESRSEQKKSGPNSGLELYFDLISFLLFFSNGINIFPVGLFNKKLSLI